ncbi:MAG: hypothetical protein IJO59_07695 [Clostridia bacterium]|nr:hypothetical protein [Clostridia bacterium]
MKKRVFLVTMLLLLLLPLSVTAKSVEELYREQLEASGASELLEELPQETRELLRQLGITSVDTTQLSQLKPNTLLKEVFSLMVRVAREPLRSCAVVLGVVLLHAWMGGLSKTLGEERGSSLFSVISSLVACATVITPISACISQTAEVTQTLSVFMMSFVPVYAAVLLTCGHAISAVSFQSIVLYAAQILSVVSDSFIVPLMGISLALGVIGSVTAGVRMGRFGEMIGKTAVWVLTIGTMLFTGLLSLQNLAGSATDSLGSRMWRFSLASFVPVVGASLSEAFSTIRGCLGLLRSTTGAIGIAVSVAIVLPTLLKCLLWNLCLSVCGICGEVFELDSVTSLIRSSQSVMKCLIAVLCAGSLFAIIAVTVVTMATKTG